MVQELFVHFKEIIVIDEHNVDTFGSLLLIMNYFTDEDSKFGAFDLGCGNVVYEQTDFHLMLVSARESAMLLNMTSGPSRVKSPERTLLSTLAYKEQPASRSTIKPLNFPSASE